MTKKATKCPVTRILVAKKENGIAPICKKMKFLRNRLWQKFGGMQNVGLSMYDMAKIATKEPFYKDLVVDGTIKNQTMHDVLNDILTYKAAAKDKVKKSIHQRYKGDNEKLKELYTMLKKDEWTKDKFLSRQMRKHFKHGQGKCGNQFIVSSDRHYEQVINGKLHIVIQIAKKYGPNIVLKTRSNGKNVDLAKKNLRVISCDEHVEIHYNFDKGEGRACGEKTIGVYEGSSVAFADSDGEYHGEKFGNILTEYSERIYKTGKNKNKIYALEKKLRKAGKIEKADRIKKHNLGKKKVNRKKALTQKNLRQEAFKAAHSLYDKAGVLACQDLISKIGKTDKWKRYNRRMSNWGKGVLMQALEEVAKQRSAKLVLVNPAYAKQIDSDTGKFEGEWKKENFCKKNGEIVKADVNAAKNILSRLEDKRISRYTKYKKVKEILSPDDVENEK